MLHSEKVISYILNNSTVSVSDIKTFVYDDYTATVVFRNCAYVLINRCEGKDICSIISYYRDGSIITNAFDNTKWDNKEDAGPNVCAYCSSEDELIEAMEIIRNMYYIH